MRLLLFLLLALGPATALAPAAAAVAAPADCTAFPPVDGSCRVTVEAAYHEAFLGAGCRAATTIIPACGGTVFLDGRQVVTATTPHAASWGVCTGSVLAYGYLPRPVGVGLCLPSPLG